MALSVLSNHLGNRFAEASCLGEHGLSVSGKKKFIPRRSQNLTEPYKLLREAHPSSGARLRYAPLNKNASARKLSRIVTKLVSNYTLSKTQTNINYVDYSFV